MRAATAATSNGTRRPSSPSAAAGGSPRAPRARSPRRRGGASSATRGPSYGLPSRLLGDPPRGGDRDASGDDDVHEGSDGDDDAVAAEVGGPEIVREPDRDRVAGDDEEAARDRQQQHPARRLASRRAGLASGSDHIAAHARSVGSLTKGLCLPAWRAHAGPARSSERRGVRQAKRNAGKGTDEQTTRTGCRAPCESPPSIH